MKDEYRTENVWLRRMPNGKWRCIAYTHNWASDIFQSDGVTPHQAITKVIVHAEKDEKDGIYLLKELNKVLNSLKDTPTNLLK